MFASCSCQSSTVSQMSTNRWVTVVYSELNNTGYKLSIQKIACGCMAETTVSKKRIITRKYFDLTIQT